MSRTGSISLSFITVYGDVIEDHSIEVSSIAKIEYSAPVIEIVGYETMITPEPALISFSTPVILISGAEIIVTPEPATFKFVGTIASVGELTVVSPSSTAMNYTSPIISISGYEAIVTPDPAGVKFVSSNIEIIGYKIVVTPAPGSIIFSSSIDATLSPFTLTEITILMITSGEVIFSGASDIEVIGDSVIVPSPGQITFGYGDTSLLLISMVEPTPANIVFSCGDIVVGVFHEMVINDGLSLYDNTIPSWFSFVDDRVIAIDVSGIQLLVLLEDFAQTIENSSPGFLSIPIINDSVTLFDFSQVVQVYTALIEDNLFGADSSVGSVSVLIAEYLNVRGEVFSPTSFSLPIDDALAIADAITLQWLLSLSESISTADTTSLQIYTSVFEYGVVRDSLAVSASFSMEVSEIMTTIDAALSSWLFSVAEQLTITSNLSSQEHLALIEYCRFTEALSASRWGAVEISDAMDAADSVVSTWLLGIAETIISTDIPNFQRHLAIAEFLKASEALAVVAAFNSLINESVKAVDTAIAAWVLLLLEDLSAQDVAETINILHALVSDAVSLADVLNCLGMYSTVLNESLKLLDVLAVLDLLIISDHVSVVEAVNVIGLLSGFISDSLLSLDTTNRCRSSYLLISDNISAVPDASAQGAFGVSINELLSTRVSVFIDGEAYECFVLNTSAFHPSVYSGFNFNSYCTYQDRVFACGNDGIFEISGNTDNGENINTGILFHKTDFGMPEKKRFRKAYLGISGDIPIMTMGSDDEKRIYAVSDRGVVPASRAVKGRYWDISITDFDLLESIKLIPIILARGN